MDIILDDFNPKDTTSLGEPPTSPDHEAGQSLDEIPSNNGGPRAAREYAKAGDWERHKARIEALYVVQNLPLRDTMAHMKEMHGFIATEKMYKSQFRKWTWSKYACKRNLLSKNTLKRPTGGKSCIRSARAVPDKAALLKSSVYIRSPIHTDDWSRRKEEMMDSIRRLLLKAAEHDAVWKATTRFQVLHQRHRSIAEEWFVALDALDFDADLGWRKIRKAFRNLETTTGDIRPLSFLDLCLIIPRALFFSRHVRILVMYLNHLDSLISRKQAAHPLRPISSLLCHLVERPRAEGEVQATFVQASRVWADTLARTRGSLDRTVILASWDSIRLSGCTQGDTLSQWMSTWEELYEVSILTHGRRSIAAGFLKDDLLHLLLPSRTYPEAGLESLCKVVGPWRRSVAAAYCQGGDEDAQAADDFFSIAPPKLR